MREDTIAKSDPPRRETGGFGEFLQNHSPKVVSSERLCTLLSCPVARKGDVPEGPSHKRPDGPTDRRPDRTTLLMGGVQREPFTLMKKVHNDNMA